MSDPEEMITFVIKLKCMHCGLHFEVFSWHRNWAEQHEGRSYCPECGTQGNTLIWGPEELEEQVFRLVPGTTPLFTR